MSTNVPCNGRLIRSYREQRGWTQIDLAVHAGLSERLIRKAEANGSVRADSIEVLATALSTPELTLSPADLSSDPLAVAQAFVRGYLKYGAVAARQCAYLFAPDVVLIIHTDAANLAFGGEFHGVDGIDQMIRNAYSQFTPVNEDFGRWFTAGQRVVALRRQILRPARVEVDADQYLDTWIMHEYTVADGLIHRIDNFIDSLAWSRYLEYTGGKVG